LSVLLQEGSGAHDRGESLERPIRTATLAAMLVTVTFAAYWPAVFAGYVWDDDIFLTENPLIKAGNGLYRIWFTTEPADYFALTSTTRWLEWRIWGDNPMPYHVGNIALHAVAAVLLWRVLRRLNLRQPAPYIAGLIFAVHPVTVASVAWITERKNVLSMGLYLLSILAYLRFEDEGKRRWYVPALLAAAAALLAKTSVAMLPVVLLLLAWWRRGRIARPDILRTVPFFAVSLMLGLTEVWFEHHNSIQGEVVRPEGPASRVAASAWIVWFYLYKIVFPLDLMMIYPRWEVDGGRIVSFVPLALLLGCFVLFWVYRRSWGRGPLAALAYFVIVLAPVLGVIDMSFMRFSLVSDHLQYAAMPGAIAMAAALLTALLSGGSKRSAVPIRLAGAMGVCGLVFVLAALTWRQACTFRTAESLWDHSIERNDRAEYAYYSRGVAHGRSGDADRAIADYTKAIELKPDRMTVYYNRGVIYHKKGEIDRAIADYTKAIELEPDGSGPYSNRGAAYKAQGDHDAAIRDLTRAIELNPGNAAAHNNRGASYNAKGDYDAAIRDFDRAIELLPNFALAYHNRGFAYGAKNDYAPALRDFTRAVELKPDYAEAYGSRGAVYFYLDAYEKAWADVRTCRRLGGTPHPDIVQALTEKTGQAE